VRNTKEKMLTGKITTIKLLLTGDLTFDVQLGIMSHLTLYIIDNICISKVIDNVFLVRFHTSVINDI